MMLVLSLDNGTGWAHSITSLGFWTISSYMLLFYYFQMAKIMEQKPPKLRL